MINIHWPRKKDSQRKIKVKTAKLIMVLVLLVAVTVIAVGGSVMYLTDTAVATNTFAVGDVDILIVEEEWGSNINDNGGVDTNGDGENDALLVKPNGEYEKDPIIKNVGNNDCYVRVLVKIPTMRHSFSNIIIPVFNPYGWNFYSDAYGTNADVDGVNWIDPDNVNWKLDPSISLYNSTDKTVDVWLYYIGGRDNDGVLLVGGETEPIFDSVWLNRNYNVGSMHDYENKFSILPDIKIYAEAIQTDITYVNPPSDLYDRIKGYFNAVETENGMGDNNQLPGNANGELYVEEYQRVRDAIENGYYPTVAPTGTESEYLIINQTPDDDLTAIQTRITERIKDLIQANLYSESVGHNGGITITLPVNLSTETIQAIGLAPANYTFAVTITVNDDIDVNTVEPFTITVGLGIANASTGVVPAPAP
jgi:predicted ribosomally synthesized peptide with SipW-like signal peptide